MYVHVTVPRRGSLEFIEGLTEGRWFWFPLGGVWHPMMMIDTRPSEVHDNDRVKAIDLNRGRVWYIQRGVKVTPCDARVITDGGPRVYLDGESEIAVSAPPEPHA